MNKSIFAILAAVVVMLFAGCTKTNNGFGRLVVNVTDAPFPIDDIESATVTISKVELRKAGDGISDGSPFVIVSEEPVTFDLIDLRNGVVDKLTDLEIEEGEYNLVRLYVDEASLKVKDGETYNVKVPSGEQTGIKIFIRPSLIVEGGLTSELLLDFDLSRSFIMRGHMNNPRGINGFIFKPVVRAVNNTTAGRIEGFVKDEAGEAIENASVTVGQGEDEISTAFTDETGFYSVIGLPAGEYSVSASKEGYETVTFDEVTVTGGNKKVVDFTLPAVEEEESEGEGEEEEGGE